MDEINQIRAMFEGPDRRSIGAANRVASLIATDQALFDKVVVLLRDIDPCVRMRAADALEKASCKSPRLVQPHVSTFLRLMSQESQQEVLWHILQMLPRAQLDERERRLTFAAAKKLLNHPSRIVSASALSAMAELSTGWPGLQSKTRHCATTLLVSSSPSLRARAKHVLASLAKATKTPMTQN